MAAKQTGRPRAKETDEGGGLRWGKDHWDPSKLLSYNAAMNFAISGLGSGKTTKAKKMVLDNYRYKREKFV
ncbi:MAG TPA: hypothetical protein VFC62_05035 [Atopostipes sp.]|nr:hypothetical protein [Atopostipes sp.]